MKNESMKNEYEPVDCETLTLTALQSTVSLWKRQDLINCMNIKSLSNAYYIRSWKELSTLSHTTHSSTTTKATFGLCETVAVEVIVHIEELRLHPQKV